MKKLFDNYYKPTPKLIRKMADAILGAMVFAGTFAFAQSDPTIGKVMFYAGITLKFLSNFFADDQTPKV